MCYLLRFPIKLFFVFFPFQVYLSHLLSSIDCLSLYNTFSPALLKIQTLYPYHYIFCLTKPVIVSKLVSLPSTFWVFTMVATNPVSGRTRYQCDLIMKKEYEKWKGIKPSSSPPVSSKTKSDFDTDTDAKSDSDFDFDGGKADSSDSSDQVEVVHIDDSEEEVGSVSLDCGLRKKGVSANLVDGDEDSDLGSNPVCDDLGLGSELVLSSDEEAEQSLSKLAVGSDIEEAEDTASDLKAADVETMSDSESDSASSEGDDSEDENFDVGNQQGEEDEKDKKEECERMDIECEKASTRSVTVTKERSKTEDGGENEIGCEEEVESRVSEMKNKRTGDIGKGKDGESKTNKDDGKNEIGCEEGEGESRVPEIKNKRTGEKCTSKDGGSMVKDDGKNEILCEEGEGESRVPDLKNKSSIERVVKSKGKEFAKAGIVCEEARTSSATIERGVKSRDKRCAKAETICEDERTSRVTGRMARTTQVQIQDMECEEEKVSEHSPKSVEGKSWVEENGKKETKCEKKNDNLVTQKSTKKIENVNFCASGSKKLDMYSIMVNSIWKKDDDKPLVADDRDDDDVGLMKEEEETRGQTIDKPKKTLPLKFTFGIKESIPVVKSEADIEIDNLWDELDFILRSEEVGSITYPDVNAEKNDPGEAKPANSCEHEFVIDDEIGVYCRFCYFIKIEIRDFMPDVEKLPTEVQSRKVNPNDHDYHNNDVSFDKCKADFEESSNIEDGTVWDLIPGTRESMYPHQQEGFEFLWKNLAGSIDLKELKKVGINVGGGCIISHAPGTGKTLLSIAFLQSYLKQFPHCRPVIMAPASLLLTWEEEFQKWKVGIPFHNLSSLDLSGNEDSTIVNGLIASGNQKDSNHIRMAKLFSWIKKESVLGLSYSLYEKLVGDSETYSKNNSKIPQQLELKKILLEKPGLIVFDEGHTPRNDRSRIWKALIKLQTEKRIILSGTPFQNNFHELYNTLKLVRPASMAGLPPINQFGGRSYRKRKAFQLGDTNGKLFSVYNAASEVSIEDLKKLMSPFLHVHKGNILQKSLPGLKDCVVVLKPSGVQEQLIKIVEGSERSLNVLDFEHKFSLVSIHPSLILHCSLSEKEKLVLKDECGDLKQLEPNHSEGVKTRFVVEFLRIVQATKEKVLIFSQFIPPLRMIINQLSSSFTWSEGTEILYMHGKLDNKQRQLLIHTFNDPDSKAKVFLASTKACSEGISLVGASRVILLDVVWNPSVERQAISRAYRLGQKRLVYTYHLIIKDTTEWDKYMKQAEKDRMAEKVFCDKNNQDGNTQVEVSSQDEILDELYQHGKLTDMFDKVIYHPKEAAHLVETFDSGIMNF